MEKIILIESKKYYEKIKKYVCPEYRCVLVNKHSIKQYSNHIEIVAIVCTRGLARMIQMLDSPGLQLLQLESVGYDDVDIELFKNKGIAVCNAKSIYDNCLAEYVIFAMLIYAKRFYRSPKRWMFSPFQILY